MIRNSGESSLEPCSKWKHSFIGALKLAKQAGSKVCDHT